ncbi:MAG: UDP-N-acetylmuramoyl-tripeptide--D-alanyl-D-alanine ligase [Xanthomonadales bacterium]|nr:UDP-N-acetylmuramoyl-tripeptide--D-alanyl-D-alanine ligase [Xanthomonadales bacterium]
MDTLDWVAQATGGTLHGQAAAFTGVTQDTRTLQAQDLYVALKGERFDGHTYVRKAASLGAAGALVSELTELDFPQVLVDDGLRGLQSLARGWLQRHDLRVVAVTGSNGKTTVKQMLAAILEPVGSTLATPGNLNNHIGLPLTLLRLRAQHRYAVLEMGASKPGDIAELVGIAPPQVAVITHAAAAHLQGFGGLDGVARTKGEIYGGLSEDGVAVINADDAYADLWTGLAQGHRRLRFGLTAPVEVTAKALRPDATGTLFTLVLVDERVEVRLPVAGRHNVMNALAAAAAAHALGCSAAQIADGLSRLEPAPGRMTPRVAATGAQILDDTYNANPASLAAALSVLAQQDGRRWLALGNMNELGADAQQAHRQAGEQARAAGVQRLFVIGDLAVHAADGFGAGASVADSMDALVEQVAEALDEDVCLLVKGSRGARMERLVQALAVAEVH